MEASSMTNAVNTQHAGCDEQELVNGVNITEKLRDRQYYSQHSWPNHASPNFGQETGGVMLVQQNFCRQGGRSPFA
jgi:hypothetical protein